MKSVFIFFLFIFFISIRTVFASTSSTVTPYIFDLQTATKIVSGIGSGYLNTHIKGDVQTDLFLALKPRLLRTQSPYIFRDDTYQKAKLAGSTVQLVGYTAWLDTYWGQNKWPGDEGDFQEWIDLTEVLFQQVEAAEFEVEWDIWNEPDYPLFWGRDFNQYLTLWNLTYKKLRELNPNQKIVGPSLGTYSFERLTQFLTNAISNNTIPNVLTWHELWPFSENEIAAHVSEINNWMFENNISIPIDINEYSSPNEMYSASASLRYLVTFENLPLRFAATACWPEQEVTYNNKDSCFNYYIDGLLNPTDFLPRPRYWVYSWYAQMMQMPFVSQSGDVPILISGNKNDQLALLVANTTDVSKTLTISVKNAFQFNQLSRLVFSAYSVRDGYSSVRPDNFTLTPRVQNLELQTNEITLQPKEVLFVLLHEKPLLELIRSYGIPLVINDYISLDGNSDSKINSFDIAQLN